MPEADRLLLAIDTSSETAGLALYDGEQVSELTWVAGRNQTARLLDEINHLLRLNGMKVAHLRAVGVAIGPGSFNGLRVGMSVAKGLCFGLAIPLIGVVTLDAVAYPHARSRAPIRAFIAAGRQRVVYADYRYRHDRWVRLSDLHNEHSDQLADGLSEKTILAGELSAIDEERFGSNSLVVLPSPALRIRRPSYLAEIAFRRWQAGDVDELATLEPVYVHGTSAARSAASS